jgi:superfamily II DNA or RNA helicase
MRLRKWQEECTQTALDKYATGQQHMMVLAAPGSGKTYMAADLTKRLFELDLIDLVLCFAPTQNVVNGIRSTFSKTLNGKLEGNIKDVGDVYTYQGMLTIKDNIWTLLNRYRVFVVLDEIHHCAGGELQPNAWGQMVLNRIQNQAEYTLALSGTPWRSDSMPVVLANYCNEVGRIECDYTYNLAQAVEDKVCRIPNIELVDHSCIVNSATKQKYHSIQEAMNEGDISLKSLVTKEEFEIEALRLSVEKLQTYQKVHKNAGGLVVASSVKHAERLLLSLETELNQSAVIVSCIEPNSSEIIDTFRHSNINWIVSIGMVSEGTDIPRLRVTCMLSTIQTEMFFRQLLGRTQRLINGFENNDGWLVALNAASVEAFSERLHQEIPAGIFVKTNVKKSNFSQLSNLDFVEEKNPYGNSESTLNNFDFGTDEFRQQLKLSEDTLPIPTEKLQFLRPKFILEGSYSSRIKHFHNVYQG